MGDSRQTRSRTDNGLPSVRGMVSEVPACQVRGHRHDERAGAPVGGPCDVIDRLDARGDAGDRGCRPQPQGDDGCFHQGTPSQTPGDVPDVRVLNRKDLPRVFKRSPQRPTPVAVERVHELARRSTTWT